MHAILGHRAVGQWVPALGLALALDQQHEMLTAVLRAKLHRLNRRYGRRAVIRGGDRRRGPSSGLVCRGGHNLASW
jgi:hypothetical protein